MKGILNCFECGSPSQRLEIANLTWYDPSVAQDEALDLESWNPEAALAESHGNDQPISAMLLPSLTWDDVNMAASSTGTVEESSAFPWVDFDPDPLAGTTAEIVQRLGVAVSHHFKGHEWLPCTEALCTEFFRPSNIRKFIRLFWGVWYPNCCIIHKPTFCILTAPLPLLLSMAMIGASVSVYEEDTQRARLWFDAVEELVFGDDCFQEALTGCPGNQSHSGYELLRALQASYFVCVYQNWEGSNKSRERIRRLRYSMVVTVARNLELSSATHGRLDLANFDWHEFVRDEELIRTLLYVFLIDTAFTIFNNLPPRLAFSELKLSLACPEPCFQSQSADDCLLELHMASSAVPPINTVASAIETLCEAEICPDDWQALSRTGILNLFIIISALHVLIFNAKTLMALKPSLLPIQQGLKNWKRLWDKQHILRTPTWPDELSVTEMWKREGFMKHAGEYWALAAMKLERMKPPRSSRIATIPSKPSNAEKYDDTNLEQVIDLIQDFRKIAV
ncbi:hypothetical protein MW887_000914 [Aspergillus wentii]|nr:hypothetical protein MW887_000914 [Aspergillus wentii]